MDERLEKALDFSNYMVTLNNQKRILKEKFKENTLYYFNGGQFTVTKELITFVNMLVSLDNTRDVVLIDDNDLPVLVSDLEDFFDNLMNVYFTATNSYHSAYKDLKKKRSVAKLVDYE
jgi:phage anti-repressor protein